MWVDGRRTFQTEKKKIVQVLKQEWTQSCWSRGKGWHTGTTYPMTGRRSRGHLDPEFPLDEEAAWIETCRWLAPSLSSLLSHCQLTQLCLPAWQGVKGLGTETEGPTPVSAALSLSLLYKICILEPFAFLVQENLGAIYLCILEKKPNKPLAKLSWIKQEWKLQGWDQSTTRSFSM